MCHKSFQAPSVPTLTQKQMRDATMNDTLSVRHTEWKDWNQTKVSTVTNKVIDLIQVFVPYLETGCKNPKLISFSCTTDLTGLHLTQSKEHFYRITKILYQVTCVD